MRQNVANRGQMTNCATVLSDAPTKENCLRYARAFGRGYGSVEQVFRWAASSEPEIRKRGRQDDTFIRQVKRIAKQLGSRVINARGGNLPCPIRHPTGAFRSNGGPS